MPDCARQTAARRLHAGCPCSKFRFSRGKRTSTSVLTLLISDGKGSFPCYVENVRDSVLLNDHNNISVSNATTELGNIWPIKDCSYAVSRSYMFAVDVTMSINTSSHFSRPHAPPLPLSQRAVVIVECGRLHRRNRCYRINATAIVTGVLCHCKRQKYTEEYHRIVVE